MLSDIGVRGYALNLLVSLASGLCFFLFGYDQGMMGGLLTIIPFNVRFPQIDMLSPTASPIVSRRLGITLGSWNLGAFFAAALTIFFGDRLGRKKTIMLGLTMIIFGEIIQSSSYTLGQFIAGRVVSGLGNGFNSATVPAWQAECCRSQRRGTMLMISAGSWLAAGLAAAYWMVFSFSWLGPVTSAAWRTEIALALLVAVFNLLLVSVLPESPRWLVMTGREDAALRTLSHLNDIPVHDNRIRDEFLAIKEAVIELAAGTFGQLFDRTSEHRHFHRVILAVMVQVFQQACGINSMIQLLAGMYVYQIELERWKAMLFAACNMTFYLIASLVAVVGIDRFWGRRTAMLLGSSGMCISMIALAVLKSVNTDGSRTGMIVMLWCFTTCFAVGWQGMSWLYSVEIVPLRVRGPANAISSSANWITNFIIVLVTPVLFNNIKWKTYVVFAVFNAVIIPCVYFLFPETSHRSLGDIDIVFHAASLSRHPWTDVVKISKEEPLGRNGSTEAYSPRNLVDSEKLARSSDESASRSPGASHKGSDYSPSMPPSAYRHSGSGSHERDYHGRSDSVRPAWSARESGWV